MHRPLEGLSVLVVDDEAPARLRLTDLLALDPHVASITEAANGVLAQQQIADQRPDLVFLDVQMPLLSGLDMINAIGAAHMPLTVFVTAYDMHAIRAFESNALDYLLKPFSDERFEATMARARGRLAERQLRDFGNKVLQLLGPQPGPGRHLERLAVKTPSGTQFVRSGEIDWISSCGVYVNLHVASRELLYRTTLNELGEKLNPAQFVRIHRTTIVNLDSIVRLEARSHGEFELILKDGARPRVSRTYRPLLEKMLGLTL